LTRENKAVMKSLRELYRDRSGATMIEYALMLGLIAIVCFAALSLLGRQIAATHQSNADAVQAVTRQACEDGGNTWDEDAETCTF
jgi:Flp pilus assembly pilin Flp